MSDKRIRIILDSKDAEKNAKDLDRSLKGAGKSADGAAFAMKGLAAAIAVVIAVEKVAAYADAWTEVQNQLKRVTSTQQELTKTSLDLLKVANDTRSGIADTTELYVSLRVSTQALGLSQEKNIGITKTINNLFVESGKSAAETSGAIRQLGQALQSGALRGDEFNSIAEGAPGILRALQKETGKSAGALREFAADGKITSELLVKALDNYAEVAQIAADKTQITLSQSMIIAKNSIIAFSGTVDSATGFSGGLAKSIADLSKQLTDPEFLAKTKKISSILGSEISTNFQISAASATFFFDTVRAGFTDTTLAQAIEKYKKSLEDIGKAKAEAGTGLAAGAAGLIGGSVAPAKKTTNGPTKEEIAAAKKSFEDLLNIQSEFWDAVDAEGKSRDSASKEIASAAAVTESLKVELEKRRQISDIYRDKALSDDNNIFAQQTAMQRAREAEDLATLQASDAERTQRREEQLRLALESKTLEESEKQRIEQEYADQALIARQITEEQKIAIEEDGARQRERIRKLERDSTIATTLGLGEQLMTVGQNQSKRVFEIGKKAAIASALISTYQGIAKGVALGYPAAIPAVAAAALVGLAQVQKIRSTNYGSGGGGGGGVSAGGGTGAGGDSGSSSAPSNNVEALPQQKKIYDLRGVKADDKISVSAMAALLEDDGAIVLIENAREDAARRNVIGVTAR